MIAARARMVFTATWPDTTATTARRAWGQPVSVHYQDMILVV
jgi:hypothetical protein